MKKKLILAVLLGAIVVFSGFSFQFINKQDTTVSGEVSAEAATGDDKEDNDNSQADTGTDTNEEDNDKSTTDAGNIEISDEDIDIIIPDDNFITTMDSIFDNLDLCVGRRMKVEGIVANVDGENFSVVRLYDMPHEDHSHEVTVGINAVYNGEIGAEETWVEVIGTIDKKIINGQLSPILKVEKLEKKFSWGQAKVYN